MLVRTGGSVRPMGSGPFASGVVAALLCCTCLLVPKPSPGRKFLASVSVGRVEDSPPYVVRKGSWPGPLAGRLPRL